MRPASQVATTFETVRNVLRDRATPYAIIGAFAAVAWGRPRATSDVDLVVVADEATFAALQTALLEGGLQRGGEVGPAVEEDLLPDIAIYWSSGEPSVRVDLFIAKTPFEAAVIATAREVEVLGAMTSLASPEACVVYKLLASRRKDLDDIDAILDTREAAGAPFDWSFVERWAAVWGLRERVAKLRRQRA